MATVNVNIGQMLAKRMVDRLGITLVALACDTRDRKLPTRWIDGKVELSKGELERVSVLSRVWDIVSTAEGDDVARLWFCGNNSALADKNDQNGMPVLAIRDGRYTEVMGAAFHFASGEMGGY